MIKIIAGTIFGVLFVSPALSTSIERIDLEPLNEIFKDIAKEGLRIGLQVIQDAI